MAIHHADPDLLTAARRPQRTPGPTSTAQRFDLAGVHAGLAGDRADGMQARSFLALQRQVGNQAVTALVQHGSLPAVQRCGPGGCPDGGCGAGEQRATDEVIARSRSAG
jgi:hypothetical protein